MNHRFKAVFLLVTFIVMPSANAGQQDYQGKIIKMYAYAQYGGGDIQINVTNPPAKCAGGFWLSPDDAGFDSTLSFLLSGYHAKTKFQLTGDDTHLWGGSGTPYCRLVAVGYVQ